MAALSDTDFAMVKSTYTKLFNSRFLELGQHVDLDESLLHWICDKSIPFLKNDDILLKLDAPLMVVGDVHGQFNDAMEFIAIGGDPKDTKYLFLGDYVDRGLNSIETITALLCLKMMYPKNVYMLRGNHETKEISKIYGFFDECIERYNSQEIWDKFNLVFDYLPLAAIISDRIFCVHGGISQQMKNIDQIREISRPLSVIQENSFINDLLWADPSPDNQLGYQQSERGISFTFGHDVARQFLDENDFDLICRAHQVVIDGYEFPFYPEQTVVTVFSAPNYCQEFGNKGAMLKITDGLACSFEFIEPKNYNEADYNRPVTPYTT